MKDLHWSLHWQRGEAAGQQAEQEQEPGYHGAWPPEHP